MAALTREEIARRVVALDPSARARAVKALRVIYGDAAPETIRAEVTRDPDERRRLAGDPWRYIRDVLGYRLVPDQEHAIDLIIRHRRLLLPSGNGTGKTFLLAAMGLYYFDAVAAMPDEDLGLEEQGAIILLPGPDHATIFSTIYSAMLQHADHAERRGYKMPGRRSDNSVLWRVGPRWQIEAISPRERKGREVEHSASGRHHRNMIAIIEEGQGVPEPVWKGSEGMCSGEDNRIVSAFNPTESSGPCYKRARGRTYQVFHISALQHPNVIERRPVIPGAISVMVIDERIREECRDLGRAGEVTPDDTELDFVWTLPGSEPHVYRPSAAFTAQVLGQWPRGVVGSLFDAAALDRSMARWTSRRQPDTPPDLVGVDPAREGRDSTRAAPRWGDDAEALLRAFADAKAKGEQAAAAIAALRESRRQYVGPSRLLPKGDGVDTATTLVTMFPASPFAIDDGGIGASVYDHTTRVIGRQAHPVSFGGAAQPPTPGEPWSENVRTQLYVRTAILLAIGLVDAPHDPELREELLAHTTKPRTRSVTERGEDGIERKVRRSSVLLIEKEEVKRLIGRSPDRADAFVLAVNGDPSPKPTPWEIW